MRVKQFEPVEEQFGKMLNNIKLQFETAEKAADPFLRVAVEKRLMLDPRQFEPSELVKVAKTLTFDEFEDFCLILFENIQLEWLIQGHLTGEQALELVYKAEMNLGVSDRKIGYKKQATAQRISLPRRSIFFVERQNELGPNSENSATLVSFHVDPTDSCYPRDRVVLQARLTVLATLLKEPFALAMQDAGLSYREACVQTGTYPDGSFYLDFRCQSSERDPDFIEYAISLFVTGIHCSQASEQNKNFNKVKQQLINRMADLVGNSDSVEVDARRNWSTIVDHSTDGSLDFVQRKLDELSALNNVALLDVFYIVKDICFAEPRRLNIKMYSHAHYKGNTDREQSKEQNKKLYADLSIFGLDPPLSLETVEDVASFRAKYARVQPVRSEEITRFT